MKLVLNGVEFEAHLPTVITPHIHKEAKRIIRRFDKRVNEKRKAIPILAEAAMAEDTAEMRALLKSRPDESQAATEEILDFQSEQEEELTLSLAQALIVKGPGHLTPEQVAAIDSDVVSGPFWPLQDYAQIADEVTPFRSRIR